MPTFIDAFAYVNIEDCLYTIGGMNSATIPVPYVFKLSPLSTSTKDIDKDTLSVALHQNFPNPFNAQTMISYILHNTERIMLKLYDYSGEEVMTLFDGIQGAGRYEIIWKPKDLPGGVYFYHLITATGLVTKKCILLK